jgi:hypothetical protein
VNAHYDDGGFSGGTMDRPALKQPLNDIFGGKNETLDEGIGKDWAVVKEKERQYGD